MTTRSKRLSLLAGLLWLLFSVLPAGAAPALPIGDGVMPQGQPLGHYLDVYKESRSRPDDTQLPADDVDWQTSTSGIPNYGLRHYPVWFRLTLDVREPTNDLLANIALPLLDTIDLYLLRNDQVVFHTRMGDTLPFADRPLKLREFATPLPPLQPGQYRLYFRVATGGSMQFPLYFWHDETYHHQATNEYIVIGAFIGLLVSVVLYNSFIYVTTREAYALAFVGHVLTYLVFFISLSGIGYQYLFNDSLWLQERMINVSASASGLFACLFARYFLYADLKKQIWLSRLSILTILLSAIALLGTLVLPHQLAIESVIFQALFATLSTLLIGVIIVLLRPSPSNILYITGWTSILMGVFFHSLAKQGLVELTPLINYSAHIGSLVMVTAHSLGIALRFHEAKLENMKTEKRLLEAQRDSIKARFLMQESEIKRQKTEAENEAKSAFLATMSHEIRTPLNGVLGMLQLLRDTRLDQQQQRYVETINSSGESLLTIVNDILDLSKMNSGKLQLELRDIDLHALIRDCVNLYARQAREKGLRLIVNAELPLYRYIHSDSTRLRQIISNLLSNAVKFTDSGYVLLTVKTSADSVNICVKDTGIGIAEEFKTRLFEHFSQADASTSRNYGGTGLGLSISKKLAILLGGDISVNSEPEEGTEFCLTLKNIRASGALTAGQQPALKVQVQLSHDDEAQVTRQFLTSLGHECITAQHSSAPDLIITDTLPVAAATRTLCIQDTEIPHPPNTEIVTRPLNTLCLFNRLFAPELNSETPAFPITSEQPALTVSASAKESLLIWVAEDNLVNQKVITGMLRHLGYPCLIFNDGQAVVHAWHVQLQLSHARRRASAAREEPVQRDVPSGARWRQHQPLRRPRR